MFAHTGFLDGAPSSRDHSHMGKRRGGDPGPKLSYAGAFRLAQTLFPHEIRRPADFNHKLDIRSQDATNWQARGIPKAEIWRIADKLRCSLDLVRAHIEPGHTPGEEVLTEEELLLVRGFRSADENTRALWLNSARMAVAANQRSQHDRASPKVTPLKKRAHRHD